MNKTTIRQLLFGSLFASLILPGYLLMRFHHAEILWLYIPIGCFWADFAFQLVEEMNSAHIGEEEQNHGQSITRPF